MFKRILVALDFSDVSDYLVEEAARFALTQQASVHLLHVDPLQTGDLGYVPPSEEIAKAPGGELWSLSHFAERFSKLGVAATSARAQGRPARRIIEEAEKQDADLIILGSHGHGKLYNLLSGSVREEIMTESRYPVLVLRKSAVASKKAVANN